MAITTFAELKTSTASKKITIAEFTPAEDLVDSTWVQEGSPNTSAWGISYLNESITLVTGDSVSITKIITSMESDGTVLSLQSSIATVHANANSFWHDTANEILYVNVGGQPIATVTVLLGFFTLYFGTHGIELDPGTGDVLYKPYIDTVPNITFATDNILSGYSQIAAGDLVLNNSDGFWNLIIEKYVWENNAIVLKLGGEDLPYSEYTAQFTGTVFNKGWDEEKVVFDIRDGQMSLLRTIPEELYTTATYPNMDANKVGRSIPIGYGNFPLERDAVICTMIDDSDSGNDKYKFKFGQQTMTQIYNVYVSQDSGATFTQFTAQSPSTDTPDADNKWGGNVLADAEFIINESAGFDPNKTVIKVAFQAPLSSGSDITKDLLQTWNGAPDAKLDLTSFANSASNSENLLRIYIDKVTRTDQIIDKICRSDLAFFFVNSEGEFDYHVFVPEVDPSAIIIDRSDLLKFDVEFDSNEFFTIIKVGHTQSPTNDNYLYVNNQDTAAQNKYKNTRQKLINTYLDNSSDGNILGQRQLLMRKTPTAKIKGVVKFQLAGANIGDKIKITSSRAPINDTDGYNEKVVELTRLMIDSTNGQIAFEGDDLKGIGTFIGFWVGAVSYTWSTATDAEKNEAGFHLDDNGFADGTGLVGNTFTNPDPATKNVSNYW